MWLNEFVALLSGKTITLQQIDQAYHLKDRNLPKRLYKFRAVNDYALDNLQSDTAWVCSTDQYNDPYECSTTIGFDRLNAAGTKHYFEQMVGKVKLRENLTDDDIQRARASQDPMMAVGRALLEKDATIPQDKHDGILRDITAVMGTINDATLGRLNMHLQRCTKVCSFSARNDSILMWSHYANNHTGFCIEYDVSQWPHIHRRMLYPVIYSPDQLDITDYITQRMDDSRDANNLFGIMAATRKSPDWAYESEWRFVITIGESFTDRNIGMPRPVAIYIGTRTKDDDVKRLTDIATAKGIPAFHMRLSNKEFRLTSEPLG